MNSPASNPLPFRRIGVVGSGAMGRGIAQLFAQVGLAVRLHDANPAALASALSALEDTFAKLVEKGRLAPEAAQRARASLEAVDSLDALAGCDLVVEAIVEQL